MKPGLCPDFPFVPSDWLSSAAVAVMTPAQELAYFRLLLYAWAEPDCSLPANDAALAIWSRMGSEWEANKAPVLACFEVDAETGRIFNARQRRTRDEQNDRIAAASEHGRRAIAARWAKRDTREIPEYNGSNTEYRNRVIPKNTSSLVPRPSSLVSQRKEGGEDLELVGEVEARAASAAPTSKNTVSDEEWIAGLKADPAYQGIDVDTQHARMVRWCTETHKQPSRRRFINWLNRCDRTMDAGSSKPNHEGGF